MGRQAAWLVLSAVIVVATSAWLVARGALPRELVTPTPSATPTTAALLTRDQAEHIALGPSVVPSKVRSLFVTEEQRAALVRESPIGTPDRREWVVFVQAHDQGPVLGLAGGAKPWLRLWYYVALDAETGHPVVVGGNGPNDHDWPTFLPPDMPDELARDAARAATRAPAATAAAMAVAAGAPTPTPAFDAILGRGTCRSDVPVIGSAPESFDYMPLPPRNYDPCRRRVTMMDDAVKPSGGPYLSKEQAERIAIGNVKPTRVRAYFVTERQAEQMMNRGLAPGEHLNPRVYPDDEQWLVVVWAYGQGPAPSVPGGVPRWPQRWFFVLMDATSGRELSGGGNEANSPDWPPFLPPDTPELAAEEDALAAARARAATATTLASTTPSATATTTPTPLPPPPSPPPERPAAPPKVLPSLRPTEGPAPAKPLDVVPSTTPFPVKPLVVAPLPTAVPKVIPTFVPPPTAPPKVIPPTPTPTTAAGLSGR